MHWSIPFDKVVFTFICVYICLFKFICVWENFKKTIKNG
nr:MAG TPA: hypothetical protein [Caudoviricetes sp.]